MPSSPTSVAPESKNLSEKIRAIWSDILDVQVTPDSNFFEEGGDSILMLNMFFDISEELGIELSPDNLFSHPSLREFSSFVEQAIIESRIS